MALSKIFFTFLFMVTSTIPNTDALEGISPSEWVYPQRSSDGDVTVAGGGGVTNTFADAFGIEDEVFGATRTTTTITYCETTSDPPKCDAMCKALYGSCVTGCCRPATVPGSNVGKACFCCLGVAQTFSAWGSKIAWKCDQIPSQTGTSPAACPCNCMKITGGVVSCPASSRDREAMVSANVTGIFDIFGF